MTARIPAIAFRLLVLVTVWLLGTSTLSLAKGDGATEPEATPATTAEQTEQVDGDVQRDVLLVPDLESLPYVFAKGVLEDAGFAWRVEGKVDGYAVNLIADQSVPPGTKVVNTGAPTMILTLKRSSNYDELGLPDDRSPYPGTAVVMADEVAEDAPAEPPADEESPDPESTTELPADEQTPAPADGEESSQAQPSALPTTDVENAAETAGASTGEEGADASAAATDSVSRPPAFVVPGAPKEPLDEMPLPRRSRQLDAWLARQSAMTPEGWDHYTFQHAWVVTGARFGWWHGAEALRILITTDETLQRRFDAGAGLERAARQALALVQKQSQAG